MASCTDQLWGILRRLALGHHAQLLELRANLLHPGRDLREFVLVPGSLVAIEGRLHELQLTKRLMARQLQTPQQVSHLLKSLRSTRHEAAASTVTRHRYVGRSFALAGIPAPVLLRSMSVAGTTAPISPPAINETLRALHAERLARHPPVEVPTN